ncbi:unnamed protein product [Urochloa decumbens]|uniref:F-box domain-containing protein n=1 Tax=Urochloa decumbens TaxID=240449 RepID=A0ABC9F0T1_9POAL
MDCSKKRASEVGDLPVDPLVDILCRVPAKSVSRFKCVSKAWRDLIADPHHRKKLPQAMQGLFCHTSKKSEAVPSHFNLVEFRVGDNEEFLSVHVYSSETGAWSENLIDEQGEEGQFPGWRKVSFPLARLYPCPFINGFLHFMVWDQDETKIVALDEQGKGRRMIPVPHVAEMGPSICYFGESQGKLHFMTEEILYDDHEYKYKLFIWVLQDYSAQEWVLKGTVNSHEVFGENSAKEGSMEFEVVGIHQDRNVVFFTHPSGHKLTVYHCHF